MLSLSMIGFATILIIVLLLISGRVAPIIALVLVPILGAFAAGFGLEAIGGFFDEGIVSVINVVIVCSCGILCFSCVHDVGLFDRLINDFIEILRRDGSAR